MITSHMGTIMDIIIIGAGLTGLRCAHGLISQYRIIPSKILLIESLDALEHQHLDMSIKKEMSYSFQSAIVKITGEQKIGLDDESHSKVVLKDVYSIVNDLLKQTCLSVKYLNIDNISSLSHLDISLTSPVDAFEENSHHEWFKSDTMDNLSELTTSPLSNCQYSNGLISIKHNKCICFLAKFHNIHSISPTSTTVVHPIIQSYFNTNDCKDTSRTIIGYGSLMSIKSARSTFPHLNDFRVIRLQGYRRVFAHSPCFFFQRGIAEPDLLRLSSLSVEAVEGCSFLGTAFSVTGTYIARWGQDQFEREYKNRGLPALWNWDSESGLQPCSVYLRHCYLAASKLGPEVLNSFLDDTWSINLEELKNILIKNQFFGPFLDYLHDDTFK
eukprot:gene9940-20668_t